MRQLYVLFFCTLLFSLNSCSKDVKKISIIKEKSIEAQVLEAYKEGMKSLEEGDVLYAAKKFNEVETLFPQSEWAPKSNLMAAYAYYIQDYYVDAEDELKIFIRKYPNHVNIDYAHYLLGVVYYEQIVDEQKDLKSILLSKEKFEHVINQYPSTDYSLDAKFKLDLIMDMLAAKEMYIGRYYFNKEKWIASINRFRKVLDDYETTIYVEEALHRLVEVHYRIGLTDEAQKYANLLGYNYQSSRWYQRSYAVFNKMYKVDKIKKESKSNKNFIIDKFKSLFR